MNEEILCFSSFISLHNKTVPPCCESHVLKSANRPLIIHSPPSTPRKRKGLFITSLCFIVTAQLCWEPFQGVTLRPSLDLNNVSVDLHF